MDRCIEKFGLERFRDLLGVPPGAYERGNDFIKRVIEPAALEVNGLSEFGVKVDVDRAYSRAPITGVTLAWWRKDSDEYRATHQERQRSKLGRMARLRGTTEVVEPLAALPIDEQSRAGRVSSPSDRTGTPH
jgi:Initiator Replication protein